jgi:RNA polymerase primary sigma factor
LSQAMEDKNDHVRQLVTLGKERGYLLFDEVNDVLPPEVHSPEEIDNLLSTLERYHIEIYEDVSAAKAALEAAEPLEPEVKEEGALSDEVELDLTPGLLEKTTDPVRIYLREMGLVPLLTREGEVALAKRIERAGFSFLKPSHVRPSSSKSCWRLRTTCARAPARSKRLCCSMTRS